MHCQKIKNVFMPNLVFFKFFCPLSIVDHHSCQYQIVNVYNARTYAKAIYIVHDNFLDSVKGFASDKKTTCHLFSQFFFDDIMSKNLHLEKHIK